VTFVPVMLFDYMRRVMFGSREHCIQELRRDDPEKFKEFKEKLRKNQEEFFNKEPTVKEEQTDNGYADFAEEGHLVSQNDNRIARLITRKTQGFVQQAQKTGVQFYGSYLGSAFNLSLDPSSASNHPKRLLTLNSQTSNNDSPRFRDPSGSEVALPNPDLGPRISSKKRSSMLEQRLRLPTSTSSFKPPNENRRRQSTGTAPTFQDRFKGIGTMAFLTDLSDSEGWDDSDDVLMFEEKFQYNVNEAQSAPLPRPPAKSK